MKGRRWINAIYQTKKGEPGLVTDMAGLKGPSDAGWQLPAESAVKDTVSLHMTRSIETMQARETVAEARAKMLKQKVSCLPVMDDGRPAGIITERALLEYTALGADIGAPAGAIAAPPLVVPPDEMVSSAIEKMHTHHVRHILVTGKAGELVGLATQTDLLEASRRQLANAVAQSSRFELLASRDALTGLLTRGAFENVFGVEFRRAERYGGLLSLLVLDIDRFKELNDRFGHVAGDRALRRVGEIISNRVRKVDFAARYGGDEYVILMPECGTRAAAIVGEHIRKELGQERFGSIGREAALTISAGCCKWNPGFRTPEEMFAAADKCLYEAKRNGRNKVVTAP